MPCTIFRRKYGLAQAIPGNQPRGKDTAVKDPVVVFNSRDTRYKDPYGAVPSGTQVRFTLRPARAEGFSRGSLTAVYEFDGNRTVRIPMPWVNTDKGVDEFSCVLDTTGYVGLVWYSFQLERLDGRNQELGTYQMTVYDDSDEVPDWFGKGMCYQIFPDRFITEQKDAAIKFKRAAVNPIMNFAFGDDFAFTEDEVRGTVFVKQLLEFRERLGKFAGLHPADIFFMGPIAAAIQQESLEGTGISGDGDLNKHIVIIDRFLSIKIFGGNEFQRIQCTGKIFISYAVDKFHTGFFFCHKIFSFLIIKK
jgi:hypothetical protein